VIGLQSLRVVLTDPADEKLGLDTNYSYTLTIDRNGTAEAKASSVYGAMYALDTFWQLIDQESGMLKHSVVQINDSPQYQWRGLMIDAGRRFFPMQTVKNLLNTMAGNKMSVLHLHASDECRWGVESKLFPNLTASLVGERAGFYTQEDVKEMIAYAGDRGIRVVPEFDIPGHSRGMLPVEGPEGVQFCESADNATVDRSQLYGDPGGRTYKVVHALMKEMAGLFTDEVFNIGCDETRVTGPCTQQSTFDLERKVLTAVQHEFGKTPEGWEEAFFDAGAATNETIVNAWKDHPVETITATGRRAVSSNHTHWYFTGKAEGGPAGWANCSGKPYCKECWWDIGARVPAAQKRLLLGGEMSMWSDSYCDTHQCGASPGKVPQGSSLFSPEHDKEFGQSVGGMIWPRGFVGAAAMWNYNASMDPSSAPFVDAIWALNDKLIAAGSESCPTNCSCDQLTACGKPYLKQQPPSAA
jgi:hexosaminidase